MVIKLSSCTTFEYISNLCAFCKHITTLSENKRRLKCVNQVQTCYTKKAYSPAYMIHLNKLQMSKV